jgi:hypothetical protein
MNRLKVLVALAVVAGWGLGNPAARANSSSLNGATHAGTAA